MKQKIENAYFYLPPSLDAITEDEDFSIDDRIIYLRGLQGYLEECITQLQNEVEDD